jgi:hypothetical protein
MNQDPIFTNKALAIMKDWGLSESQVIDVLYYGVSEDCCIKNSNFLQKMRKYQGYEIGVIYSLLNNEHKYKIISAWKRNRR